MRGFISESVNKMLKHNFVRTSWCKLRTRYTHISTSLPETKSKEWEIKKIRNIGILAHIDAGKTTTTERMLFYSGFIRNMGEVHHGNTVTDYMEQERQRGITITSASVTFNWKDYHFNLIDTPGHIDFTMQVEQTLQILDGAVVVLDGTAGVEAQTLTVSRQADRYNIPRIVYINKMDRANANFDMCLRSIESKLNVETLLTQIPVQTAGVLEGIVDVITMEKLMFDEKYQGMNVIRRKLSESDDGKLWEMASEKRQVLTDKLSGLDDKLADIVIEQESLKNVTAQALVESLRSVTLNRRGVPVMLGSSYKNIGVQSLMDSVVLYLPSPANVNKSSYSYRHFRNDLAARVFKIVHDKYRGPITFFRIYSGNMKKGQKLYNVTRKQSEQCVHLYIACADDYEEVTEVGYGNIAAVAGLKNTITGDLVTTSTSAANSAKQAMLKENQPEHVNNFFASGVKLLDPVFFCSIEPPSLSAQSALETALRELQREDPSLRVTNDPETEQTVLGGMGELHIEIIKERIKREYKVDADLGPLQIAYKETIRDVVQHTLVTEHKVGGTNHQVTVTMSLIPNYEGKEKLLLDRSCSDNASNIANIHPRMMSAVKSGVNAALLYGVKLSCPVVDVGVKLHWLEVGRGTSDTMVSAAVSQCIRKLLENGHSMLMEPIMRLEIVAPQEYSSTITADLIRKRAEMQQIDMRGDNKVINTFVPLSELLGYSTALRIISSGNATFSLEFSHYQLMTAMDEEKVIRKFQGF